MAFSEEDEGGWVALWIYVLYIWYSKTKIQKYVEKEFLENDDDFK